MKTKDVIKLVLIAFALYVVWQSGILDSLAAGLSQPRIEPAVSQPIQGAPEQPIIIMWPTLAPLATATAIPVRIQSNEVESHGHSSTSGGCTTKDTPLGRVTSCVSKDGE